MTAESEEAEIERAYKRILDLQRDAFVLRMNLAQVQRMRSPHLTGGRNMRTQALNAARRINDYFGTHG